MNKQSMSENQILYRKLKKLRVAIVAVALVAFLLLAALIMFFIKMLDADLGMSEQSRRLYIANMILCIFLIIYFIFCIIKRLVKISNMLQDAALDSDTWMSEIKNLQSKYIIYMVIVMIMGSALFLAANINTQLRWSEEYMNNNARDCQDVVYEWLDEGEKLFFAVECILDSDDKKLNEDLSKDLRFLMNKTQLVSDIYIFGQDLIISTDGIYMGEVPEGIRDAYTGAAEKKNHVYITQPYDRNGEYVITISKATYMQDGTFIGVVCIDCSVDKLNTALSSLYDGDGYAFIVEADNTIVTHPNKKFQMHIGRLTNAKDAGYGKSLDSRINKFIKDYDGNLMVCKSFRISDIGYTIVIVKKWNVVYGRVVASFAIVLCVTFIVIFAMLRVMEALNKSQRKISSELESAAAAAKSASKVKSEFLANISHEVRTPINSVIGINEMVYNETDQPEIREYAKDIHTASRKLLALINSILDFSTLEANELVLCNEEYSLASAIVDIVDIVGDKIRQKNLDFEVNVDEELPSVLKGDITRIRMIVHNLLTNAIKATEEGKITLDIKFSKREGKNVYIYVGVTDTGCGIKDEDKVKLFDSFNRLEEERYHSGEGAGLGLAISDRLLKMMGSGIKINSRVNEGSRFYFTLAQEVISEEKVGDYHVAISLRDTAKDNNKKTIVPGTRVLVVDDTEMNINLVKKLLKKSDAIVQEAGSAQEAIELLKNDYFDMVLLDYMMPVMDGIEVLRYIRDNHIADDTPFVVMTAYVVAGAKQMFLDAGFVDYLAKPFRRAELEDMIAKYATGESHIARIKELLPEIDINAGLSFCGDSEAFYEDMLEEYVERNRLAEIEAYFMEENWEMFRISVHALKGTSLMVGLTDFSEEARLMESSVKNGDIDYVEGHYEALIKHYEEILDAIWQMFE